MKKGQEPQSGMDSLGRRQIIIDVQCDHTVIDTSCDQNIQ